MQQLKRVAGLLVLALAISVVAGGAVAADPATNNTTADTDTASGEVPPELAAALDVEDLPDYMQEHLSADATLADVPRQVPPEDLQRFSFDDLPEDVQDDIPERYKQRKPSAGGPPAGGAINADSVDEIPPRVRERLPDKVLERVRNSSSKVTIRFGSAPSEPSGPPAGAPEPSQINVDSLPAHIGLDDVPDRIKAKLTEEQKEKLRERSGRSPSGAPDAAPRNASAGGPPAGLADQPPEEILEDIPKSVTIDDVPPQLKEKLPEEVLKVLRERAEKRDGPSGPPDGDGPTRRESADDIAENILERAPPGVTPEDLPAKIREKLTAEQKEKLRERAKKAKERRTRDGARSGGAPGGSGGPPAGEVDIDVDDIPKHVGLDQIPERIKKSLSAEEKQTIRERAAKHSAPEPPEREPPEPPEREPPEPPETEEPPEPPEDMPEPPENVSTDDVPDDVSRDDIPDDVSRDDIPDDVSTEDIPDDISRDDIPDDVSTEDIPDNVSLEG